MIAIGEYTISALNDLDYYEVTSSDSMVVIEDENFTPEAVTFTSKHRLGNGNLEAYSGRFKIETSKDGETWETKYTSSGNESAVEYELPSALEDKVPYLFRKSVGGDRAIEEIVGGSVVWNQLAELPITRTQNGIAITNNGDGSLTIDGTASAEVNSFAITCPFVLGHVYMVTGFPDGIRTYVQLWKGTSWKKNLDMRNNLIKKLVSDADADTVAFSQLILSGTSFSNVKYYPQIFDLTTMFGTQIADYIYSLEQSSASSGIAKLRSWGFFTKDYYPYCLPTIRSVSGLIEKRYVGFNQWDEEWELYNGAYVQSKNYIPIIPNTEYYLKSSQNFSNGFSWYDGDKNLIKTEYYVANRAYTSPENAHYAKFMMPSSYGTAYNNDICINISNPAKNGTYEPYEVNTYSLDSSVELRGMFKLDSNNNLYADGDIYSSDGTVSENCSEDDLSTLVWSTRYTGSTNKTVSAELSDKYIGYPSSSFKGLISSSYSIVGGTTGVGNLSDPDNCTKGMYYYSNPQSATTRTVYIVLPKGDAPSGSLLYFKATPTTSTALPYHNPQELSECGTEEFVTTGIIPVGHNTKYPANIKNIRCSLHKPNETPSATTLLDQITVPIVSGLQYQPFVQRTVFEWTLSSSSTELDENTTWAEQKPKPTQAQPYLWERSRNDYSNGTHTYSDAHCDVTISGVISDVDKINGQITNKIWQSDITTSINSYDGTTVSNIRDRVSTTEQNLTGITTRVGAVESTTGSLGTRMTAAESSISQNADNIELKVSKDGVISSINQSSESITISADKVNIAGSTAFTSLNSQVTAIQNETNQKSELIRGTQTAATYSWTGTSTTISQLTDGMEIRYWLPFSVAGGTVSGSYSYYDGSKTTTGTNTGVGLTLTLKDGTMTEEIPVYYGSMSRLTSHYGYGNIIRMIYRENVRVNNGNTTYYTVEKGFWCDANYDTNSNYTQFSSAVTVGATNSVYQWSLIMRDSANTWVSIATSHGAGTSKSAYTGGLYYDKILYHSSGNNYASGKSTQSVYDSIGFDLRYSTNCGTTLTTRKPVYLVGTINNTDKRFYLDTTQWWTQTVPTSADGKTYIYIGEAYSSYQVWLATENKAYQYYNGRFITLEEIKDLEAMSWINSTGQNAADIIANWATDATSATTTINGGLIQTHTIQASHLATNAIMSNNYQASQNAGSPYSVTGSFLDLDNGNFYTPNFGLDNVNGNAYFNGEITATSGQIGDDTSNHWQIGTVVDFNGNQSAAIESNGTSYIQSGDWMISNNRIDTRHYDNQRKYTYLYEDGVYWDFGLHTPSLTSDNDYENNFIYIRNHESTIPTLEGAWNYVFRVDRNGMIYINGVSLDDKYASIDGVSGAYLPMTGGSLTGNLSVGGNLSVTGTITGLKNLSINGKTYNGSSAVNVGTIGAAYGGTGQTSLINSANALINALDTGSSTPVDNDYYISQYVNGGTTTKTYHRRPMSALWLYIKGKINADTDLYTDKFVPKTGGEFTGAVTVSDALIADEITSGNLIVNGVGRFTNGIYGDLTGNASTATLAAKVADSGNGQATTFGYSKSSLSTTAYFAAWDGYELRKISPANALSTIGGQPAGDYLLKSGGTMTGVLNIVGQMENAYVGISNSNYSMKLGIGTGGTNRGLWDMNLNKWVLYSDASASYFNGNATSATSATTATKFSSSRTIQLTGDVIGSASSNGESGWSIATTVADNSHSHVPSNINTGNDYTTGSLDWIASAKIGSAASNKSFGLPPEAIVVEYSTDGGSTWLDYGSSDAEKANLFNELGCYHHLGKAKTKAANTTNCQLRITITATDRYVYTKAVYFWVSQNGNEMTVDFDVATLGNPTTFSNVFNNRPLQGNSGPNIHYYAPRTFGAYTSSQTGNSYVYRFTFKQPSIASNATTAGSVSDIRLFGDMVWTSPNNMVSRNHMYTWDKDFNVTFPAKITATSFEGNATSASKLSSTRSFTIGKTAKNVDWSGAVSFSQAEISDNASTSAAGWMSKDDKTKLNGIEANAQVNTITGVKGNSETTYRTGDVNITASNIGLGNLTNNKQVKGLSSGTTSGHLVTWGSDGYTVADSGIAKGSVTTKITLSGSDYSASSNTITITKANLQSAVQDTSLVLMTAAERSKLSSIQVSEGGTIDFSGVTASAPITATVNETTKAVNITHNTSGVTQGTYRSVTVNTYGHVTAGTNPTTLSGYGITDAKIANGVITLGSNTITPLTASSTLDATKLSGTASIDTTGNATTATTASNVEWSGITSNPIEFGYTSYGSTGWKQLGGRDNGSCIKVWKPKDSVAWGTVAHSAVMSFGNVDTKGMLDISYNAPLVSIAGGNVGGSTDNAPKWYFKLSATSGATYTLPSSSKTLAASDGSNASGTWGIGISGNATTATKFSSNRSIALTGDVTGSASSNGENGWSISTTVGDDSHGHTPDTLYIPSDFGKTGGLDLISGSKVGSYMSNKSFAIPPEAITIEYSTDNGSTWKDYGATDSHKKGLFSETRYGCHTHLGKATTKEANSVNNQLRITISRINLGRCCAVDSFYTWMTTNGNTVYCKLEHSTNSNPTSFQTIFTDFKLAGWSGHNIKYFSEKYLGGSNNDQTYAFRLTVWQTAINTDYSSADLYDIRFFGRNTYSYDAPYYKLQTNELYTWDNNLNAIFPAKITATSFEGVTWNSIADKPINLKSYSGSLATGGWATLNGKSNSPSIAIAYNNNNASWNSEKYSSSMVFGCYDVRGLLDLAYNQPIVTFGGSSYSRATDDNPKWYFKLKGTSEQTYTFPSTSKTLAATDGSNASGTWGISISGNANTATTASTATKATQDGSGNTITSYYVTLSTNQTISGTKTFSAMPVASAGLCVGNSGTAGGLSLWNDKDIKHYGLALRTTADSGKHGYVQGDYATYNYMYAASASALPTRGWIFKDSVNNKGVASISGAGNAVFNGSITVGGNVTNTSGCRQEFNEDLQCLEFIFN